jgi:predicted nucleic acid-binding protein
MNRHAVVDTSVFIGIERGRTIDFARVPRDTGVLSVVTLAELHAGVLAATDLEVRARRMETLSATSGIELLGIDEATAKMWARMRAHIAQNGRRVNVNDLWIAASAASRGLPVVTQDDDFAPLEGIGGLEVIRV